jgi:DNA repair exonuclease SbcCD nuclease subunit
MYEKTILLSDIHLMDRNPVCRTDNLVKEQFQKLSYVFDYANKNGMIILQAGDLFDRPRSWELLHKFILLAMEYDYEFKTIFGQHDMIFRDKETSNCMNILRNAGYLNVLSNTPSFIKDNVAVYGCSYGEEIPKPDIKGTKNILVIHKEIGKEASTIGDLEISSASIFLRTHPEFDLILCGDIHEKFFYELKGRYILNTGMMLRKDVTQIDHKPCFAVLDLNTWKITWENIPCEDNVISREHIDVKQERTELMNDFVQGLNSIEIEGADFKDNLNKYLEKNKIEKDVISIINKFMEKYMML